LYYKCSFRLQISEEPTITPRHSRTAAAGSGTAAALARLAREASDLANPAAPKMIVRRIDLAVSITIGGQAITTLAETLSPHDIIRRVDRAISIVISSQCGQDVQDNLV
jgi:hypothetical protein